jgi:hypothetical protein
MGCHSSNLVENLEILNEDLPTVPSSLNNSASFVCKSRQMIYSSTKFLKIKSAVTLALQELPNFQVIFSVLESFERLVYERVEDLVQNYCEIGLSMCESTKPGVTVMVQAEGLRKFSFLNEFLYVLEDFLGIVTENTEEKQEKIEFITELASLTVTFELSLGQEIDFLIGVNKPIDRRNISKFLQNTVDRRTLIRWCHSESIPISLQFSLIKPRKSLTFYLFDGEKAANFEKAFAIFDCIGSPLPSSIKNSLIKAKTEETYSKIIFENEKISEIGLEVNYLSYDDYKAIGDIIGIKKPNFIGKNGGKKGLQLDSAGFSLINYTDV